MESIEALITSKLESARQELAEKEERKRKEEERERDELELGVLHSVGAGFAERERLATEIRNLNSRVQVLEEIKDVLDKQHAETKAQFVAIEKRDVQSTKQNFWLSVVSSAVSRIVGWLLSLVGSPATILHIFAH